MPLERLNPDTIYPPYHNNYTQVVITTGTRQIHVAGMVSFDENSQLVGEGDMRAQTECVIGNVAKALQAAGASAADIARIQIFTLDVDRYLKEGHAEVLKFYGDARPASTLVGVTRLADPRFLVEIHVTAVVG
jgi:enamine deaminase RidA (YjgF/YER057c/UK114 family)